MQAWFDYQSQQWKYLFEITRAIASRLDLGSVLDKALRYSVDIVGGIAGLVALRGSDDSFYFAARYGIEERLLKRFEPLLTEIPLTIERDTTPRWNFPELQIRFSGVIERETLRLQHVMAIPLIASEQLLGIIYVFRSLREAAFTAMDQDALSGFADHVAIAIEHAQLYDETTRYAQELSAVIEGSGHGILIAGRTGAIRSMNRMLEELTGWPRTDAEFLDYTHILQITDEHGQPKEIVKFSDEPSRPFVCDGFVRRRDGTRGAFVHATLAPLYDENRHLSSIVGNIVDLTAFRETDELKTTFLAGISHDLKTPLALIRGYVETLRRTDVEWDRKTVDESLAVIQDEAEYLTNLVNALLDAAQLERGHLPLHKAQVNISETAKRIVERFQSIADGHRWSMEFAPDTPLVRADPERIREVLQNLVGNAVKYSPRGTTITVGTWTEPNHTGIFVRDEGPGISLEEQARVFDRFVRGRGKSAQRAQGAGLGLYLCRAIIEQHGGRIWVENLPERGAAFYFTLPRQNPAESDSSASMGAQ